MYHKYIKKYNLIKIYNFKNKKCNIIVKYLNLKAE